jgi:uncharacterized protein (DUF2141 family)
MKRVLASVLLLGFGLAPRARASDLLVTIHGLESAEGRVEIDVYGERERATFPYSERGFAAEVQIEARTLLANRQASVSLGDLAPGRYAVSVIHDANGNGDIDRNLLGVPTESYGFSNNARPKLAPPSFDDAAVVVRAGETTRIDITLSR